MTDIIDRAAKLEQKHRDAAIARARQVADRTPQTFDGDTIVCACCGMPIPLKRLALNPHATLCVECKSQLETRERR
ncbi:MAG: TraR/DksA C4-type zinc finger protein [Vibrio sp.]|uniref:TraR/DksA C4-type zinc finger protein n=1 Tax=Vibrio sp. TaxID=678 RepID=UPI003A89175A